MLSFRKPKGEAKPELSLAPVAKRLSEMLNKEVVFAADDNVVGENAKSTRKKWKMVISFTTKHKI